ncbi:Glycerophosphocholine phosphodiesterase [Arthrobotrys megalospora]
MSEHSDPYGRYSFSGESQRVERKPVRGYDNSARGNPVSPSETSTYGQSNRVENSAPAVPGLEHLSINPGRSGPEHIDASDFYRFNSTPSNTNASPRQGNAASNGQVCEICLVTSCVMNGGSREAQRLKNTIVRMKTARSKAQMLVLGMDYMDPYIEAFDNLWKLDTSTLKSSIKDNLSLADGKLLAETSQGLSPITAFVALGKTELVAILLHEGAVVNYSAGGRPRPLSHAVTWLGNEDIVEMLLAAQADPNAANEHGLTALHFAVSVGNIKAVKLLVEAGANLDAQATTFGGIHSLPVFHKMRDSQMAVYGKIIDFLVESGASTDLHDTTKWTPLQYICVSGSAELARRLIEIGVPKEPLDALRNSAASEWAFSGYYRDWAIRLEETI